MDWYKIYVCACLLILSVPIIYNWSYEEESLDCHRRPFLYIFCGLECVGQSFAHVAHFAFLGDVRARIVKRLWSPGIDSKEWIPPAYVACMAGRYDNPIPPRFLAPTGSLKFQLWGRTQKAAEELISHLDTPKGKYSISQVRCINAF